MSQIHILLVEDNEGDILLTTEALEVGKVVSKISVVRDGKAALDFLEKKDRFKNAELPDLILLDINLPRKNGHEVLQIIKKNDDLKHIPVIMLSTSSFEKDIAQSYNLHANCFITKSVEVDDFFSTIASIKTFWTSVVKLPVK